ncbi:MAG: hypothetical protein NTW87_11845 [Planctomycetota bacterium]|nr:hypothetical protein [Planctomycetota bacterium]
MVRTCVLLVGIVLAAGGCSRSGAELPKEDWQRRASDAALAAVDDEFVAKVVSLLHPSGTFPRLHHACAGPEANGHAVQVIVAVQYVEAVTGRVRLILITFGFATDQTYLGSRIEHDSSLFEAAGSDAGRLDQHIKELMPKIFDGLPRVAFPLDRGMRR